MLAPGTCSWCSFAVAEADTSLTAQRHAGLVSTAGKAEAVGAALGGVWPMRLHVFYANQAFKHASQEHSVPAGHDKTLSI